MLNNASSRSVRPARQPSQNERWRGIRAVLLALFLAVVISAVLLVDLLSFSRVILNAGDVSGVDILAPYDLTYDSEIRTRQAQDARASLVQDIYDPPDVTVARQQEVLARQILDYMSTVRQDEYATSQEKARLISAIPDLGLSSEDVDIILGLDEAEWQEVKDETVRVLLRAMQGEIRESQVPALRRQVPTLISYSLTDDQSLVVESIVSSLVTDNTFYNAARTEEARQKARDDTPPVPVTYQRGEAIVRAGDLVRAVDIEALDQFGLRQQETRWESIVGAVALALVLTLLLALLISRLQPSLWSRWRAALVTILLVGLFVLMGRLMLPYTDTVVPYLYPLPALSMLLAILFGPALGISVGVIVALLGAYLAGGSMEITVYLLAGTLMGALALGQGERIRSFMRAGLAVALTNAAVILLFGLLNPEQDMLKVAIEALVGIVSGAVAASLTLAAFFLLSALLDVVTPFQLIELSRPTHPLFRQLLFKAPGSYHHSLLVANMAEEAAERIGADGLLTRVGTYYHDIGKTVRPFFFTENRVGQVNPHERLDPRTSARIIISHVLDGLELAEQYHLPSAVRAFIPEHHGTGLTLAFYRMAVKAAEETGEEVNEEDFRYPGPKPQSRETAILMLADGCEARIRSAEPQSTEEIERLIRDTISARLDSGQLNESDLTLRDLENIAEAFADVLQGVYHPRVKYPEPVKIIGPDGRETEI